MSLWQPAQRAESALQDVTLSHLSTCLRWTYHDLLVRVESLATLLKGFGCMPGMRLAAVVWNSAEWALFFWTAVRTGMVFVPIDPRVSVEIRSMLSAVLPEVLIVQGAEEAASSEYWEADPPRNIVLRIQCSGETADGWRDLSALLTPAPSSAMETSNKPLQASRSRTQDALVIFTSGTTGHPKGCRHADRNLVAQISDYDSNLDLSVVDRWLIHTPVSHIFAVNNALRAWKAGDAVVFASRSFDVASTLTALQAENCSIMSATPSLITALLGHPEFPDPDTLSLSLVTLAGTDIGKDDVDLCRKSLGAKHAIQAYGLSEGAPLISWSRQDPMLHDGFHAGVGKVLPGAAIRICRPGSRDVVAIGEIGELHAGGPSMCSGYLDNVDNKTFYDDMLGRWYMTGDQASIDEKGVIHILGRYKDVIIRGGENIRPAKIEAALTSIQGVQVRFCRY